MNKLGDTAPFILNNFGNTQGANTAVLTDNNGAVLDAYFKNKQQQFQQDQFKYQKDRNDINDRLKALDLNTAGTWEVDLPPVNEKVWKAIDYIDKNPSSVLPTKDNMDDYLTHIKQFNDLNYYVAKSKSDKATYDAWKSKMVTNKDYATPENNKLLEDWKAQGVDRPAFDGFPAPQPKNNVFTLVGAMQKDLLGDTTQTVTPDANGTLKTSTIQNYALDKVPQYLQAVYQSSPDWQSEMDTHWASLTPQQQATYKTPANAFSDVVLPLLQAQRGKEAHIVDWAALNQQKSNLSQQTQGANESQVVDYGVSLYNPQSQVYTGTKNIDGTQYDYAPAQADMYVKAPTRIFKESNGVMTSVTAVGGFLRDPKTGKVYAESISDPDSKFPIDNYHTQVITPTLDIKYKGSPNYKYGQFIQNYAPTGDPNDVLKIPRSQGHPASKGTKSKTKSETKYSYNGTTYTQSDVEAAAKASGLTVDEYIKQAGLK